MCFAGALSSCVQFDGLGGDRSSWKQQALWLMQPTSFRDGSHPSVLSPLSPLVSPASQSHSSDKVVCFLVCSETIVFGADLYFTADVFFICLFATESLSSATDRRVILHHLLH